MVQEVYIDLYFLINVSMDLLCLLITAALLHRKIDRRRALAAAAVGGGYAVAALLFSLGGVSGLLLDIAAAFLICTVAFYVRRMPRLRLLQCTLVQALVSMILGGVMTALYACLNRLRLPFEALQGDGLSVWTFALLTAVAGIATVRGGKLLGLSQKTKRVTLHVILFGKSITLSAMVDSGNLLRDPVSGKSVIVAEIARISPLLPPNVRRAYESNDFTRVLSAYELAKYLRPIPTQTATGKRLLFALVPDALELEQNGVAYPADYLIAPAPLGTGSQEFDAVISPE